MVLKLPNVPSLTSFRALCSEDAELDFFKNIMHLQESKGFVTLYKLYQLSQFVIDVLVQLPSIIHQLSNFLKNRLESIRDEARAALVACLKELGLEYLQFIVKVLSATLKLGYELHLLGYTLNFILSKFVVNPIGGKLDYWLEDLLSVVEIDIFGDKHLTLKVESKLESMLNNIAAGIECNPSVDQSDLFVFLYTLIEDGIAYETGRNKSFSVLNTSKQSGNEVISKIITSGRLVDSSQSSHLIAHRVLDLSKYDDIISDALRYLAPLVGRLLPALKSQADKIRTSLLVIAHGSINISPMMQSCLRLLAVLLHNTQITLSEDQWHVLIQCPLFIDLKHSCKYAHSAGRETVLEMLHAFVIKFPKHILDEHLNTIFMHLVLCLANDNDNNIRSMTGAAVKLLIGHVSKNLIPSILEFSLSWYSGGEQQVRSAAAQVKQFTNYIM
ncbi:hypothetical protein RHGRI_021112 [Rhododendron griersonianum]|uniref:U3 small nucleolar RNA-associated protein 20 domain-containing protein n=1 Tax=Rhododendron griersonianum TaxID=479676 RepID=A0AAV6JNH5_9ERIC|nr:hypothetical protein RHGRI_021112 [Rhododendron griersonianum]